MIDTAMCRPRFQLACLSHSSRLYRVIIPRLVSSIIKQGLICPGFVSCWRLNLEVSPEPHGAAHRRLQVAGNTFSLVLRCSNPLSHLGIKAHSCLPSSFSRSQLYIKLDPSQTYQSLGREKWPKPLPIFTSSLPGPQSMSAVGSHNVIIFYSTGPLTNSSLGFCATDPC